MSDKLYLELEKDTYELNRFEFDAEDNSVYFEFKDIMPSINDINEKDFDVSRGKTLIKDQGSIKIYDFSRKLIKIQLDY